jgi:hypothetical protein
MTNEVIDNISSKDSIVSIDKTEVIYGTENVVNRTLHLISYVQSPHLKLDSIQEIDMSMCRNYS